MKRMLAVLIVASLSLALRADTQETIASLKARADAAQGKQQVEVCTEVAQWQAKTLDTAYTDGNIQQAQTALADVVNYGVKAAKAAVETRKRMKQTEIALRRIGERLETIRKTLDLDDRPPVADAVQKLEAARSDLLAAMFRK
jgi:predicted DNA-binding helix-hairpin-helix protein